MFNTVSPVSIIASVCLHPCVEYCQPSIASVCLHPCVEYCQPSIASVCLHPCVEYCQPSIASVCLHPCVEYCQPSIASVCLHPCVAENLSSEGLLELRTAFSRDQSEKVYVQDLIKNDGRLLWGLMEVSTHTV